MKIIALQGRANCGKTSVITKLYLLLCSLYQKEFYVNINQVGDFGAIFKIQNHIVGITSVGDNESELEKAFSIFKDKGCELCVVCCRKKHNDNKSKECVEAHAKLENTEIVWYNKAHLEFYNTKYNAGKEMNAINEIQAKVLLEEILLQI